LNGFVSSILMAGASDLIGGFVYLKAKMEILCFQGLNWVRLCNLTLFTDASKRLRRPVLGATS
jgi:hypothetical protein